MSDSFNLRSRIIDRKNPVSDKWPLHFDLNEIKCHFIESKDDIQNLSECLQCDKTHSPLNKEAILRQQIMLIESSLDFYLHEVYKYCVYKMFIHDSLRTKQFKNFSIPIGYFADMVDSAYPEEIVYSFANHKCRTEVYLSPDRFKDILNFIGIDFDKITLKFFSNIKSKKKRRKKFNDAYGKIFNRRNMIVHQNDISHLNAKVNNITESEVAASIIFIGNIVDSIHEQLVDIYKVD